MSSAYIYEANRRFSWLTKPHTLYLTVPSPSGHKYSFSPCQAPSGRLVTDLKNRSAIFEKCYLNME